MTLCNTHTRGLTLMETLVWIAVFGFAMGAITSSILYFYRTNRYVLEQAHAISEAQRGVERMVRSLREASYASDGAYPIVAIATSSVTFYADIDTDSAIERVRYFLSTDKLVQGITNPIGDPLTYTGATEATSTVANTIRNGVQGTSVFTYYDANGASVISAADIIDVRFVSVNVIANVNPISLPNEFTLRSSATLRNLQE